MLEYEARVSRPTTLLILAISVLLVVLTLNLILLATNFPISFFDFSAKAQFLTFKDLFTYNKQSNFIKEFRIPLKENGLKGIATDSHGNAWFYHSTNKTSTIIKFNPLLKNFTQYDVKGKTVVSKAINDLAGGQLVYDNTRNSIWVY